MDTSKQLLAISCISTLIWVVFIFLLNAVRRRYDVLSWRNLFLIGFAFFYSIGGYFTATKNIGSEWYVPQLSGFATLAWVMPLFLVVFMTCNLVSFRLQAPVRALPAMEFPRTTSFIMAASIVLTAAAIASAILVPGDYLSGFFTVFKSGYGAAAVALSFYLLINNSRNPAYWLFFGTIFILCGTASTSGEIGRRGLLSVLAAIPWMWYFATLRYKKLGAVSIRMIAAGFVLFAVIAAYGSLRGVRSTGEASFSHRINQFKGAFSSDRLKTVEHMEANLYNDTTNNTLFIVDNYPGRYPYITGNGPILFLGMPVPRNIWRSKPEGLGLQLKYQMNQPANLGPGIIGHGWAEGGVIGVLGYAIFFGLLTGVLDRAIAQRSHNPIFIAALGSSLGNVVGLPRGETSIFLALCVAGFVATWASLSLVKLMVGVVLKNIGRELPPLGTQISARHAGPATSDQDGWPNDPEMAYAYGHDDPHQPELPDQAA